MTIVMNRMGVLLDSCFGVNRFLRNAPADDRCVCFVKERNTKEGSDAAQRRNDDEDPFVSNSLRDETARDGTDCGTN